MLRAVSPFIGWFLDYSASVDSCITENSQLDVRYLGLFCNVLLKGHCFVYSRRLQSTMEVL